MNQKTVEIVAVTSRRQLKDFVELPFRIYAGDPNWVPPLRMEVRWMLDSRKNPFWRHAQRELFLCKRGSRTVGRIASIADPLHNATHREKTVFFGFFECENDQEAARALLAAVEVSARRLMPDCDRLRGPLNPSMNDEVGALVPEVSVPGPPMIMMTYNPAYYIELFAAAGFQKEKDVVAIQAPVTADPLRRLTRITEKVRRREPTLVTRMIDMKRFAEELKVVKHIYNTAWEKNWGFVPMTSEEIDAMASKLKDVINPDYVWFAELEGKPAAFLLGVPDFNQVLLKMNGSLLPFGWLTFLRERKKVDQVRVMAFGVVPEFRRRGLDAVLYCESLGRGVKNGLKSMEFSWMLEDNLAILRDLEVLGGSVYRTYRLFSRQVPFNRD